MKPLFSIFACLLLINSWAFAYNASEVARRNPEITQRFEFLKQLKLSRPVTIAVIGDYIYTDHFQHLIALNKKEINGNHVDDDQNGYEDDYFGLNLNTGHGRLYAPVVSGHENGIVSLLDAIIKGNHLASFIKVIPLNITSETVRFDDQYIKKLADAMDYARLRGVQVISISLGVPADSKSFFEFIDKDEKKSRAYFLAALQRAQDASIIMLGANSNNPERDLVLEPVAPGNSPGVLSVANVNFAGVLQSAYGRNVDLAFYGTDVTVWRGEQEGYRVVKGASLATPLVALTMAVAKSLDPKLNYQQARTLRGACEKNIIGKKNISSGCVFSPEKFIKGLKSN